MTPEIEIIRYKAGIRRKQKRLQNMSNVLLVAVERIDQIINSLTTIQSQHKNAKQP